MENKSRRNLITIVVIALIILILLLINCQRQKPVVAPTPPPAATLAPSPSSTPAVTAPATAAPGPKEPDEVLTPATVQPPAQVLAGADFQVAWTGPANRDDYLTIVRKDAPDGTYAQYALTRIGNPLSLTAPVEPGECEVRYMTSRARSVLGRAPITVLPAGATLSAVAEITLDTTVSVAWTGPDNPNDYITIVAKDEADGKYGTYTLTNKGSPLTVNSPLTTGEAEVRYMTGQGGKVLARRPIKITVPEVSLAAATDGIAGSVVPVTWTGPANQGDYITVVSKTSPDGQYGNYTLVSKGSPLDVTMLIEPGDAELRYMTGRGAKVLGRRPIRIVAAEISLAAPAAVPAGEPISVTWIGPANQGDYITVVPKETPDGQYGNYVTVSKTSTLIVNAPKTAGAAELRYMSGQGAKVLARRPITITP